MAGILLPAIPILADGKHLFKNIELSILIRPPKKHFQKYAGNILIMVLSLRMEIQETDEQRPNEQQVAIYSKWAILGFSICFSPILGGILLMLNLRSVGLKKEGTSVLLFAIAYRVVAGVLLSSVIKLPASASGLEMLTNTRFMMYSLVADIIGGGILAEYFFKKYFPADHYEHKSIMKPLFIMIMLIITLGLLVRM